MQINSANNHSGFVLVTGLVFLIVIALAAITSMEMSNLDYRMATNSAFKEQSFQASETGRIAAGDAVNQFVYERSWDGTSTHSGISFTSSYSPLEENSADENLFDGSSLLKDMDFNISGTTAIEKIKAGIYIVRAPSAAAAAGGGLQQLSGYRGAGKGVASSGSAIYFELRAKGLGSGGAETVTASEYRTFIQ